MKSRVISICLIVLSAMLLAACGREEVNNRVIQSPAELVNGTEKTDAISELPVPSGTDKLVVDLLDDLAEPPVPENQQADYNTAFDQYKNGDSEDALKSFYDFITKYPGSTIADDALKMTGDCYNELRQHAEALNAFAEVILKYPDSSSIASAYYNIAYTYNYKLESPDSSVNYYIECLRHVRASDSFILGHAIEALKSISDIEIELAPDVDPQMADTTYNPPTITLAEYNKIHPTATYDDVIKIIGGEGKLEYRSGSGKDRTTMYRWEGAGDSGAYALVTFINGIVDSKEQHGLK